ncbi:MAG: hypothetical protein M3014_08645 [Chloroflexota bacterium]|nr:hypothetical protein [Chloroflexota bacterium]
MIDIHAHIIPDLDDGPRDMETSVGMGRIFAEEGVSCVVSTSHSEEASATGRAGMESRLELVRAAWIEAGLDIELKLGMEIYLQPDCVQQLRAGNLWSLAGSKYVLVELPYQPWPAYANQTLFALQVAGYSPVLAHPERYTAIQNDPNVLYELVRKGVLAQVTGLALAGSQGSITKKCAETLVKHHLVQFISTDAHGDHGKRVPSLLEAVRQAQQWIGEEAVHALVEGNPRRVVEDRPVEVQPERVSGRKWGLGDLFRR